MLSRHKSLHTVCSITLLDEDNRVARPEWRMREHFLYWLLIARDLYEEPDSLWDVSFQDFNRCVHPVLVQNLLADGDKLFAMSRAFRTAELLSEAEKVFQKIDGVYLPVDGRIPTLENQASHPLHVEERLPIYVATDPPAVPSVIDFSSDPKLIALGTSSPTAVLPGDSPSEWFTFTFVKSIWSKELNVMLDRIASFFPPPLLCGEYLWRVDTEPWILDHARGLAAPTKPGCFPWNYKKKRPLRHGWRRQGNAQPGILQGHNWEHVLGWPLRVLHPPWTLGAKRDPRVALGAFITYCRNRQHIWEHLSWIERVGDAHFGDLGSNPDDYRACLGAGTCYRLCFDWTRSLEAIKQAKRGLGWHGTSLYCLHRICRQRGLAAGWSDIYEGSKLVSHKVFFLDSAHAHGCLFYSTYHQLRPDGWLYCVWLQLDVDWDKAMVVQAATIQENSSLRRRMKQFVAESEFVKVNAVYVHMIHVLEVVSSSRDVQIAVEPGYDRQWEIDPTEPWSDVLARSEEQGMLDLPSVSNLAGDFEE